MRVTWIWADNVNELNTTFWRCIIPHEALNRRQEHESYLVSNADFTANSMFANVCCKKSDVIVVERNIFKQTTDAILYWKSQGKLVLANFDDAYQYIEPTNASYPFWALGKAEHKDDNGKSVSIDLGFKPLEEFKEGISLCHGIVTPSKVLSDDWKHLNKTYLLPNYFDINNYMNKNVKPHDGIIIGWGGSMSHFQSWSRSGVLEAVVNVVKNKKDVRLLIAGNKDVYNAIPLPEGKKVYQGFVPFSQWAEVIANFDIGLAPLEGRYDQRRSWIKIVEYMLMKTPFIASKGLAYQDLYEYGVFSENQRKHWLNSLNDMIDNLPDYKKLAEDKPYKFAMTTDVDDNVDNIINLFRQIADDNSLELK